MKILFIYKYEYNEPIGIMSLSAFLKQYHECYFVDLAFEGDYLREIYEIKPDIIAYSITTGNHVFFQKLNVALKTKFSFLAIFGGPHATFFPDFVKENGVDAICRGEGEYPLLELANALENKKEYVNIQNLWIKHEGKIYRNELRPLISDLDSLPFVDRDIVNKYKYYRSLHRRMILAGRGCPYNCSYCFNHSYNKLYKGKGKIVRKRSVENVMIELKQISEKYKPRKFVFIDDTFNLLEDWCMEFCCCYEKEIRKPFIAYVRVNLVNEKILQSLKQAGCITVVFAIESGNDYIRNKVLRRNINEKQIVEVADLCKKYKLRIFAQNMLGIPDEKIEYAFDTINLNIRCKPDYAWCSIFQPYPGTDLYEYSKEKGYLLDKGIDKTYFKNSILKIKNKTQIINLHHLFSVSIAFPFLLPLVRFLIKLPLGKLYYYVWYCHRVWGYTFRVKMIDLSEMIPDIGYLRKWFKRRIYGVE